MGAVDALDQSNSQAMLLDPSNVAAWRCVSDYANTMSDDENPVYAALLRFKPADLTLGAWATKAGLARNIFNNVRSHGNPKTETLQKLLDVVDVSLAQFYEAEGTVQTEVRSAPMEVRSPRKDYRNRAIGADLPLYGSAVGGEYLEIEEHIELTELHLSEVLDYLSRPASLAGDLAAYALTIVGDSMSPRFKPNERVAVSPRATVGIGDDVIVQLRGTDTNDERVRMVLIKELCRRTSTYVELKQHNPETVFRVPLGRVAAMHKVKGHYL